MEDQDRKILTEFLGECWHEWEDRHITDFSPSKCKKCGYETVQVFHYRTFDTWEDFGMLWEKIKKKDLAISLIHQDHYGISLLESWRRWERETPEERCLILLESIQEGILKPIA